MLFPIRAGSSKLSESIRETDEVLASELKILREDLDPSGIYTRAN